MRTTVSSKGQIVLPAEIRRQDRIEPGQEFEVEARLYRAESKIELDAPEGWRIDPLGEGRFRVRVPEDAKPGAVPWRRTTAGKRPRPSG